MNILDIAIAKKLAGGGGGSGTDDYNDLSNLPKINDTTLSGNKSSSALGLQSEITSENKLDSDLIDDTNQDNKFVTSTEKNTWNGKQNAIDADHKLNADYVDDSTSTNKFVTATDKETWNAKQNAIDNSHKLSSDLVDDANHTNKFVTSTEKQTWNGKQNAIDSEHKLSSSLVSFTTSEAAALASGIDSAKVAQISTNQSNILYGLEHGSINLSSVTGIVESRTTAGFTIYYAFDVPIPIGEYRIICDATLTDTSKSDQFRLLYSLSATSDSINITPVVSNGHYVSSKITLTRPAVAIDLYTNTPTTISNLMIVPEAMYQAGLATTYQPYALPNYDLTRLEVEDRASLAEVVDSGAKNLYDFTQSYGFDNCAVDSNGEYTAATGDTRTALNLQATINNGNSVLRHITGSGYVEITANGIYSWTFVMPSGADRLIIGHNGLQRNGRYYQPITGLEAGKTYVLRINVTQATNASGTFKWKDIMICTKAAFGVSNKFVPYRPNYDLVCASVPQTSYVVNHNVTTSNVYELVNNLYVDIPTGKRVFIAIGAKKSNPIGIALCDNNTYAENRVIIQNEVSNAQGMVSATGIYDNGDSSGTTRLYVFMKSQTSMAIQSRITLSWWYI